MEYVVREEPLGYNPVELGEYAPLVTPHAIMIDPSGVCNFKCCFCPCNNSREKSEVRHQIMRYDSFCKIVDGLDEFEQKIPVIDLYGLGEPLLNNDFCRMIKYLKKKNVCNTIRTTSNGGLFTHKLCDELVDSGLDYLKISIEGINEKNYKIMCGVDICFDEFIENIKYLYHISRGKMKIGVKIVTAAFETESDRDRYFELFDSIADYIYIRNVQKNWAEFDEMVIPEGSKDGVFTKNKKPPYSICSYPLTHMIVHSNGDIGLCCYDWKHDTAYTNISQMSVYEAWKSDELKSIRKKHLEGRKNELPFCRSCIRKGYDNIDAVANNILMRL